MITALAHEQFGGERREASRIGGEDGGFSSVTTPTEGGGGVTQGLEVEQRKAED